MWQRPNWIRVSSICRRFFLAISALFCVVCIIRVMRTWTRTVQTHSVRGMRKKRCWMDLDAEEIGPPGIQQNWAYPMNNSSHRIQFCTEHNKIILKESTQTTTTTKYCLQFQMCLAISNLPCETVWNEKSPQHAHRMHTLTVRNSISLYFLWHVIGIILGKRAQSFAIQITFLFKVFT